MSNGLNSPDQQGKLPPFRVEEKGSKMGITAERYRELKDKITEKIPAAEKTLRKAGIPIASGKMLKNTAGELLRQELVTRKELEPQIMTDSLTGLYNRKWFGEELERKIAESRRTGKKIWVLYFDIDNFKDVNSQFGHPGGDEVLKLIKLLSTRKEEPIARVGGEEFAQILDEEIDENRIFKITDRYRDEIETLSRGLLPSLPLHSDAHPNKSIEKITFSFGVSALQENEDMSELMARANAGMHHAKNEGRNRGFIAKIVNGKLEYEKIGK